MADSKMMKCKHCGGSGKVDTPRPLGKPRVKTGSDVNKTKSETNDYVRRSSTASPSDLRKAPKKK